MTVGSKLNLDMLLNAGTNSVSSQQSYLTFTNSILQNVSATSPGCVVTNTITPDLSVFDFPALNYACNGTAECTKNGITFPPGSVSFQSAAISNPPTGGEFRIAQVAFCATGTGDGLIHWQFSPLTR